MPGFIARKLCPRLVIVGTNFDKYRAVCKEVHSVLARYDPQFCPMGLDESYLDITDYVLKKYHVKKQNDGTQQGSLTPPPSEQGVGPIRHRSNLMDKYDSFLRYSLQTKASDSQR